MADTLEYILTLKDQITGKLKTMKIVNDQQLNTWSKVQMQVNAANNTMKNCGISIGSLNQKISALKSEKEWIPANNLTSIKRYNTEITKLEKQVKGLETINGRGLKNWMINLQQSIPILNALYNPLMYVGLAFYKIGSYIKESAESWDIQEQAEIKLATIMKQRMNANDGEIDSIKRLTAAQQKVGIIGDEVQLSGAQQLGTFLSQKGSLDKLIPAMNNLLAQQKGYKATAEDATNIGNLMGKVMQGQIGALTRVGITFTAAQEKVLKYGNEQQRASTLAKVITDNVGQMNKALTNTPMGALKQHANAMGDIKERVGKLFIEVKAGLLPLFNMFGEKLNDVVSWFEINKNKVMTIFSILSKFIGFAFSSIIKTIGIVVNSFTWWYNKLKEGNTIIRIVTFILATLATTIVLMTLRAKVMALWQGIIILGTKLWSIAQTGLNLSLFACPITWIIAGVIALIAVIAFLAIKIKGWGSIWSGVIHGMKYILLMFVDTVKFKFSSMINSLLIGINTIKLGWYKFKEAVGLGDSNENQAAIKKINADTDARKKAIVDAGKKIKDDANKAKDSFGSINLKWDNSKKLSNVTSAIKNKLGINEQLQNNLSGNTAEQGVGGNLDKGLKGKSGEAITGGGTRSTNVNISFKNLVGSMSFDGSFDENHKEMEDKVAEALFRVLNIAQSSVN